MTREEHKRLHAEMHRSLEELLNDFLHHHRGRLFNRPLPPVLTVSELMAWSYQQTLEPQEDEELK